MSAARPKVLESQLLSESATQFFLLSYEYWRATHRRLKFEHSLGDGVYVLDQEGAAIGQDLCDALSAGIHAILDGADPIEVVDIRRDQLLTYFAEHSQADKVGVLKTWQDEYITCLKYGAFIDYAIEPVSTDRERLRIFELRLYAKGLVVRRATVSNPWSIGEFKDPSVLHDMFREYAEWAQLLNVDYVSKLNDVIYRHQIDDVKWLAEGLHEQKLADIADYLSARFERKRVVTIAGPSSSNKTTFAKRLAIALRVNGFSSLVIEMDDYFLNGSDVPVGTDGRKDYEHFTAMNTAVLGERVAALLRGEKVPRRKFDFRLNGGTGFDVDTEVLELTPRSFLIIEGIHGMNPAMLEVLGGRDIVCPIYVSALTPVNIDSNHRFPTASLRLIRRMVRDYRYRGRSPRKTLAVWPDVRRGEEMNIFPFQENAELFFNSALVYELPVLAIFGKGLLAEASFPDDDEDPESDQAKEISKKALRLQGLLSFFYPVPIEIVPHISCIREFVGGSDLDY
jgi:uridine kinase